MLHTYYGHATGNAESFDRAFGQALAKEGFVALVPHYAHATLVKRPHQPAISGDVAAMARWLAARPEVGGKPIGAVGFSMGAAQAIWLATRSDLPVKGSVGYYGIYDVKRVLRIVAVIKSKTNTFPPQPTDAAARVNAPVLLLHGSADDETPIDQANAMKSALDKAGKRVELVVYPGAYHRFDRGKNDKMSGEKSRDGHIYRMDPKARDDAWKRTLLFRDNLE